MPPHFRPSYAILFCVVLHAYRSRQLIACLRSDDSGIRLAAAKLVAVLAKDAFYSKSVAFPESASSSSDGEGEGGEFGKVFARLEKSPYSNRLKRIEWTPRACFGHDLPFFSNVNALQLSRNMNDLCGPSNCRATRVREYLVREAATARENL